MYTAISKASIAHHTLSLLSLSLASILISTSAHAVTPEQYQEQRSDALKQQQLVNPNVTIDTTPYQVASPASNIPSVSANADLACFDIDQIYLTGELSDRFAFAMIPYTTGSGSLLGSCLSANDINQLVTNVQNRIIEKGYVTTRVLVEKQNLKSGNLFLTLIEL